MPTARRALRRSRTRSWGALRLSDISSAQFQVLTPPAWSAAPRAAEWERASELGTRPCAELGEYLAQVIGDRGGADEQLRGNLRVGGSLASQGQSASTAGHVRQLMGDKRISCQAYTRQEGEGGPEITDWRWPY